jgi:hypothetical protein
MGSTMSRHRERLKQNCRERYAMRGKEQRRERRRSANKKGSGGDESTDASYCPSANREPLLSNHYTCTYIVTSFMPEDASGSMASEHYCGVPIADRTFFEDYQSAYWHPHISHGFGRQLDLVNSRGV